MRKGGVTSSAADASSVANKNSKERLQPLWEKVSDTLRSLPKEIKRPTNDVHGNTKNRLTELLGKKSAQEALAQLEREYTSVDEVYNEVVDVLHPELHKTMRDYSNVVECYSKTIESVGIVSRQLNDCKRLVAVNEVETISQLQFRRRQLKSEVELLDEVMVLTKTISSVECLLSSGKFLEACKTLMDGLEKAYSPDFMTFEGLSGLRRQLTDMKETLFKKLMLEIDRHTYGPALNKYKENSLSEFGEEGTEWKNSAHAIAQLAQALQTMGSESLGMVGQELVSRLRSQLDAITQVELDESLRRSTVAGEGSSEPLVEFLRRLCGAFLEILQTHVFISTKMKAMNAMASTSSQNWGGKLSRLKSRQRNLAADSIGNTFAYDEIVVWSAIQLEIQKVLAVYLQASAVDSSSPLVHRAGDVSSPILKSGKEPPKIKFSFASAKQQLATDPTTNVGVGSKFSGLAMPSAYHILYIYPIILSFCKKSLKIASLDLHSPGGEGMALLQNFVDGYVCERFINRLQSDLRKRLSSAIQSPEAFLPRWGTAGDTNTKAVASVPMADGSAASVEHTLLQSATAVDTIVTELFDVAKSMPDFIAECLAVTDQILLAYLDAAELTIFGLLESTPVGNLLSRADLLAIENTDPELVAALAPTPQEVSEAEREAFFFLEHLRVDKELAPPDTPHASATQSNLHSSYHDRRSLSVLCSLHESLSWIAANISSRALSLSLSSPASAATVQSGCARLTEKCLAVSRRALICVRVLYRWRCGGFVAEINQEHFMRYTVPIEVDGFVVALSKYFTSTDHVLSRFLSPPKRRYVFSSIPQYLSRLVIDRVMAISQKSPQGIQSMIRNIQAIKHKISNLTIAADCNFSIRAFSHCHQYLCLLELSPDDLLAHVEEDDRFSLEEYIALLGISSTNNITSSQAPTTPRGHDKRVKKLTQIYTASRSRANALISKSAKK